MVYVSSLRFESLPRPTSPLCLLPIINSIQSVLRLSQKLTVKKKKKKILTKKLKWRCQLLSVMLIFIGFIKSTYLSFLHSFIQPLFIDLPRILTLRGSSDLLVERRLREKERSIHSLLSPVPALVAPWKLLYTADP